MTTADHTTAMSALPELRRRPVASMARLWILIGIVLPAVAGMANRLGTIDLAYHVRLGDLMWSTHALPRVDSFTFTAAGRAWIDQQWLAQLVLAAVHRASGWGGLIVLRTALIGATFSFVYAACRRSGARHRTSALLVLASFGASILGLALRPQLFAFLFFAVTMWALAARGRRPALVWLVPAIAVVWANVHGSFFLGPVLVALTLFEDRSSPNRRTVAAATVVTLLATLVNPFGVGVWSYVGSIASNRTITAMVTEWAAPTVRDPAGVAFFAGLAAVVVFFARRTRPVDAATLLRLGVFLALGLESGRGMFWWALVLPVVVARLVARDDSFDEFRPAPAPMTATVVLAVATVSVLFLPWLRPGGADGPDLLGGAPPALTSHVAGIAPDGSRIFGAQPLGSWFEWALPADPVFVDSRIELFTASQWRDYQSISSGQEGWQELLDRWRVDVVVATRDQQAGLIPRISKDPGWRVAFHDRDGDVFVRA